MTGQVRHQEEQTSPHLALRLIRLVLLLGLLLHQVGMATHVLAHGAGDIGNVAPVIEERHNDCHGHPAQPRICSATRLFVQRLSLPLVILALLATFTIPPIRQSTPARVTDWQWPPNRRRALLQVFLR